MNQRADLRAGEKEQHWVSKTAEGMETKWAAARDKKRVGQKAGQMDRRRAAQTVEL